jgi:hypothetical protein
MSQKHVLSARVLLLGLSFISALPVLAVAQGQGLYRDQLPSIRKAFAERGITFRMHGEEGFLEAARALHGAPELAAINDLLPTSFVIENNSGRAIIFTTLVAEVVKGSGDVVYDVAKTGNIANRNTYPRLEPGKSWLLTTSPFVNEPLARGHPSDAEMRLMVSENERMRSFLKTFSVRSIVTLPDSIVLDNGEVMGRDRYGIVAQEQAERLAIERLSDRFRSMMDDSSRDRMISFFQAKAARAAPVFRGQTIDHYPAAEGWAAFTFVALLRAGRTNDQVLESMGAMRANMEAQAPLLRSDAAEWREDN